MHMKKNPQTVYEFNGNKIADKPYLEHVLKMRK